MTSKVLNALPFSPLEGRRWPVGPDEGFYCIFSARIC